MPFFATYRFHLEIYYKGENLKYEVLVPIVKERIATVIAARNSFTKR